MYMKKIILIILLLPSLALAAVDTHYVTQSGAGSQNGTSLANAWAVSDFNTAGNWDVDVADDNLIGPGDTVYFSGTITTEVLPKGGGTAGNPIILDGYEAGDCDPLDSLCSSSAIITGGMGIRNGPDYIDVQDFRFTTCRTDSACIQINWPDELGTSDNVTVKRNYIYDADGVMFYSARSSVNIGSDYLTLENNKMEGYGKNGDPAQGVNFFQNTNLVVKNNDLGGGGSSGCTSDNVMEIHNVSGALIEYNSIHDAYIQAGIAIKEPGTPGNQDIIVRFNKIYNNGYSAQGRGLHLSSGTKYYVYGNLIFNNGNYEGDFTDGISDVHLWSNLIHNHTIAGISSWYRGSPVSNINVVNNTFSRNGTANSWWSQTALILGDSNATLITVKNNIFANNRLNESDYRQIAITSTSLIGDIDLEHNTYFFSGQTIVIYYDAADRTLAVMKSSYNLEDDAPAGEEADPGFTDPDGADNTHGTIDDDYTLDGTNVDDGADLSQCFNVTIQGTLYNICYDDALDPNFTDWTTTPPTVGTVKRDDHGWDRGAYVFFGSTMNGVSISMVNP
jgi:hypothetical protein